MSKKEKIIDIIRASSVEYLTFIAATGDVGVNAIYQDENIWLSQKMMGELYNVETNTINYHLKKILLDSELEEQAVIRKFRITAQDGKTYNTNHYNLSAIIAVGYKVNSERAVQFRKWATQIVQEFTIKGFAMDDERLKNEGSILGKKYFEEQLQRIREIRLSERKFYQKITDIYATALDYDLSAESTKRFFATVQNKLHWAIHGQTVAEVIHNRANHESEHMGLTTWKDAPEGTQKIIERLSRFDSSYIKTITFDNEKEFAGHTESAKKFNLKTYLTTPYTSQEKGTVENRIRIIRRFFPKKTDLRNVSNERIKQVELSINKRPIRKFNYLSPIETLNNKFVAIMS